MLWYFTDIATEKAPQEAAGFDQEKLKHVETVEKSALPSSQGVWYIQLVLHKFLNFQQ